MRSFGVFIAPADTITSFVAVMYLIPLLTKFTSTPTAFFP